MLPNHLFSHLGWLLVDLNHYIRGTPHKTCCFSDVWTHIAIHPVWRLSKMLRSLPLLIFLLPTHEFQELTVYSQPNISHLFDRRHVTNIINCTIAQFAMFFFPCAIALVRHYYGSQCENACTSERSLTVQIAFSHTSPRQIRLDSSALFRAVVKNCKTPYVGSHLSSL